MKAKQIDTLCRRIFWGKLSDFRFTFSRRDVSDTSRHHLSHMLLMQWSCGIYGVAKPTGYHLANGSDRNAREPGVREHKAATLSIRLRGPWMYPDCIEEGEFPHFRATLFV